MLYSVLRTVHIFNAPSRALVSASSSVSFSMSFSASFNASSSGFAVSCASFSALILLRS